MIVRPSSSFTAAATTPSLRGRRSLAGAARAVGLRVVVVGAVVAAAGVALPARAAVAQQGSRVASSAAADTTPPAAKGATRRGGGATAGTTTSSSAAAGKRRAKKAAAAPVHLSARMRLTREMESAARQVRAALIIQDTATLSHWWADEYTYTSPTGETYSKWERLEAIMSPGYVGEEQAEVLPSELDVVRRYGDVVVVSSRLGPPSAAADASGAIARSRAGRTQLLTVWVRDGSHWRTVASQATAVAGPSPVVPPPAKKKKKGH